MTSAPAPTYNYSYHAIPAAFLFGILPHTYMTARLMIATTTQMSFAMPRNNLDTWKGKLPTDLWNHLSRARGAHLNSMEVFPLFAAAMLAGNAAGMPATDLNTVAWSWFAARTLYTACYIGVKNDTLALARTGSYTWSIAIPMLAIWRAGTTAAEKM